MLSLKYIYAHTSMKGHRLWYLSRFPLQFWRILTFAETGSFCRPERWLPPGPAETGGALHSPFNKLQFPLDANPKRTTPHERQPHRRSAVTLDPTNHPCLLVLSALYVLSLHIKSLPSAFCGIDVGIDLPPWRLEHITKQEANILPLLFTAFTLQDDLNPYLLNFRTGSIGVHQF